MISLLNPAFVLRHVFYMRCVTDETVQQRAQRVAAPVDVSLHHRIEKLRWVLFKFYPIMFNSMSGSILTAIG